MGQPLWRQVYHVGLGRHTGRTFWWIWNLQIDLKEFHHVYDARRQDVLKSFKTSETPELIRPWAQRKKNAPKESSIACVLGAWVLYFKSERFVGSQTDICRREVWSKSERLRSFLTEASKGELLVDPSQMCPGPGAPSTKNKS